MGCPKLWLPKLHILMATEISRCKCRAILTIHLPKAVQLHISWPRCTLHRIENSIPQPLKRVSTKSMAHLALPEAKQGWRKSQAAPEQVHAPPHGLQHVQPTLWIAKIVVCFSGRVSLLTWHGQNRMIDAQTPIAFAAALQQHRSQLPDFNELGVHVADSSESHLRCQRTSRSRRRSGRPSSSRARLGGLHHRNIL